MADMDENERFCHDLLLKLKRTTEGLLAANSAQGVWGTYGGLRRICFDTEVILYHGIKRLRSSSESDGSFWQFLQGLKWLSPNLIPFIEKLNRHSQARRLGSLEMGRAWLRESVEDHTLMSQLDILISDEKHLHNFYHDDAFLRQPDYVKAMRICFKAIELGKPALLSDISPHLLRSGQANSSLPRSSSLPLNRVLRLTGQPPTGCSHIGGSNKSSDMGNKHAHLNVTYSNQLSNSNLSLTVDPSLGASSLLHQKTLSDPYFVSPLDSPRVLENLTRDPFSETVRYNQLASQIQNSRLQGLQQDNQSSFDPDNQSQIIQDNEQSNGPTLKTENSNINNQSNIPPTVIVSSFGNSVINRSQSEVLITTSSEPEEHKDSEILLCPYSAQVIQSDKVTLLPNCEDTDTDYLGVNSLSINNPRDPSDSHKICENVEALGVQFQGHKVNQNADSQGAISHQYSDADIYAKLNSQHFPSGAELSAKNAQSRIDNDLDVINCDKNSVDDTGRAKPELLLNGAGGIELSNIACLANFSDNSNHALASGSDTSNYALANVSDNSNRAFDYNLPRVIDFPASFQSVPLSTSSRTDISINIIPETPTEPNNPSDSSAQAEKSNLDQNQTSLSSSRSLKHKLTNAKSDPSHSMTHQLSLSDRTIPPSLQFSNVDVHNSDQTPGPYSPVGPWADVDLYRESLYSPSSSPVSKNFSAPLKSSGNVYIPQPLYPGASEQNQGITLGNTHGAALIRHPSASSTQPPAAASRKFGHKRWVSDTSTIRVDQLKQADVIEQSPSSKSTGEQKAEVSQHNGQTRRRASEFEPAYQGTLTKPAEGQSLMSYLTSQDFNTCANLEKENAHFRICEALIEAFESMKFNRMMKRQETGKSKSSSSSSSDEEIQELRQRIRIRKREKMMAKVRPFPSLSDDQTDTATNSQTASSPVSSKNEFSSFSGDSETEDDEEDGGNIDLTMSSDSQGNLTAIRSSGLNLSMASLYSDAELQRSNLQIEKNSSYDESINPGSAESIAISLLRKFSEKHLPKASELKWLVSECDAPQRLLPLPLSTPVSPDDAENADLSTNRTRLRGNLEWAPPRAQIIFSVHPPEKRATLMSRQNFRCAGCGMKVDPAFMKRYRYCAYLGKYFCQCCHTGDTSIIPGRVIEKWDFSRYPIANFSYALLEKMWREPLFHVDTINPTLYKRVRGLESIRECRQQIVHLHSLLAVCKRDAALLKEMQKMPSHWISNDDAYSMEDFTQVRGGTMLTHLKSFISLAVVHVSDCPLCQGLGFICGMCQNQQVIFPFQLDNVIKCPVCQSCYHKDCFIPGKCPKCIRLEARRKMQQEPLSPESPESGESDETRSVIQNVNPV